MKRITLATLLIALCLLGSGMAETDAIRGKIELNLPNAPTPSIEVNLNQTFFNLFIKFTIDLPEYAAYAEMIDGVFIRSYDKESDGMTEMKNHYQAILKTEQWDHIVKVKDELRVSLLFGDAPGVVNGVFVTFTDKEHITFVNVFGEIDFQKLGILFGKILESAPEIMKELNIDGKFGSKA